MVVSTISIHTSAREVTMQILRELDTNTISIHTSAREVTVIQVRKRKQTKISIHTSAREVTTMLTLVLDMRKNFNPHFRKGSDMCLVQAIPSFAYFNPHFRKGSDAVYVGLVNDITNISIHTSAREVTAIFHKNICLFL